MTTLAKMDQRICVGGLARVMGRKHCRLIAEITGVWPEVYMPMLLCKANEILFICLILLSCGLEYFFIYA